MKRLMMLAAILALSACGGSNLTPAQRDQVSDIASDVADASVTESDKVAELEGRVAELEGQVEELGSRLDDLETWANAQ